MKYLYRWQSNFSGGSREFAHRALSGIGLDVGLCMVSTVRYVLYYWCLCSSSRCVRRMWGFSVAVRSALIQLARTIFCCARHCGVSRYRLGSNSLCLAAFILLLYLTA